MSFPMPWRTAPRPADPARVVNGRIDFGGWDSEAAELQARHPNRVDAYKQMAAREALDGIPRSENPSPAPVPTAAGGYQAPTGAVPRINATRLYQQEGRGHGLGYLNNPFDEEGRQAIGRQFLSAPAGGHIRSALQGQEVFGHTITGGQARVAEQAAAGVLATGIGGWGLLSAIDALQSNNTPQTAGTMAMVG